MQSSEVDYAIPARPADEAARLAALHSLQLLDTPAEDRFDRITRLARLTFNVPMATLTLVDEDRQWFKSCLGLAAAERHRDVSLCAHAILSEEPLVVPDTHADPRFARNPMVLGEPFLRFYAGQPLHGPGGHRVGTLCILDRQARGLSSEDLQALRDLGSWAESELNGGGALSQALGERNEVYGRVDAGPPTMIKTHTDITDNEPAQEAMAWLAAIVDSSEEAIIGTVDGGIISSWNAAAEQLYGYTAEEMLGQPIDRIVPPERLEEASAAVQRLLRGERVPPLETQRRTKAGTLVEIAVSFSIIRNAQGRVVGIASITRDISERKRAEAQLQAALGQASAVLDAADEAMFLVGPDGRFLAVNRRTEELFGMPPTQLLGRLFDDLGSDVERLFSDSHRFLDLVEGTSTDPDRVFSETVQLREPVPRDLELRSSPVHSADGAFLGRLYVFRDVTHELEVDRMKGQFVSMVSHELRTPMTSIKGYIELMLDGESGEINEDQREFLGIINSNANRLVLLINDLLDISRIEDGKVELFLMPVSVGAIIASVGDALRPQLANKRQQLELDVAAGLPPVLADPDRLSQIVMNLLSNAHKYTPAGGRITVSAKQEEEKIAVAVTDTGIGINADELEKLFTRFFRAKNRTTQEVGGTGLGLAITRSLVELHGGQISVLSTPGEGSTFAFSLPTADRAA